MTFWRSVPAWGKVRSATPVWDRHYCESGRAHGEEELRLFGFQPQVRVADAEDLPFEDATFDILYSSGVLYHTPETERAIREVKRVLRPGGRASIMIYHHPLLVGWMPWARYGFCAWKALTPWPSIYCEKPESPGTKVYSGAAAKEMFRDFSSVTTKSVLSLGDMLEEAAGRRHRATMLTAARSMWPRGFSGGTSPLADCSC